jgi:outer membrane protein
VRHETTDDQAARWLFYDAKDYRREKSDVYNPRMRCTSRKSVAVTFAVLVATFSACAVKSATTDARQFYSAALIDDPLLAEARAKSLEAAEKARQERAPLLPEAKVTVTRGRQRNGQWTTTSELRITQALMHRKANSTFAAARSEASAVAIEGEAARQDLLLRAASAWSLVDVRRQERQFAIADRDALAFQAERARARHDVGLAPRIDAVETQAQLDSAVARVYSADVALSDAREALTQIAGRRHERLPLALVPPRSPAAATAGEPLAVTAARHRLKAADHRRHAARAARWPVVNLQWRYGQSSGRPDTPTPFGRRSRWVVGVYLTVPLIGRAVTSANVRQANADWDVARAKLDIAARDANRTIRRLEAFGVANASITHARESAEDAARSAVTATAAGLDTGIRSTVDALLAQSRLLKARRAAVQARAKSFLDRLRLAAAYGVLREVDLDEASSDPTAPAYVSRIVAEVR